MRYLIPFIICCMSLTAGGQIRTCADLWEDEKSDGQYYIGGRIDDIHVFRLFLCRNGQKVKGYYELVSAKKNTEVEGFFKGDSLFLAEYSPGQKVLGLIKGLLIDSTLTAGLSTPSNTYCGQMQGVMMKNWALCKTPPFDDFARIILYKGPENPDETMLLSFPNDYSCRGILYNRLMKKTFYMSGRKPESKDKQYRLTTCSRPVSGARMNCSLTGAVLTQSTFPGKRNTMTATLAIPFHVIEKSDRITSYEIHYPHLGNAKADRTIGNIVASIRHEFDSIYQAQVNKRADEEHIYGRAGTLTAWFEPSYVSDRWLCGHFIVQNNETNTSRIIALNYNYKMDRQIDIHDLIIGKKPATPDWNSIISAQEGASDSDTAGETYGAPALAFRGLLLTTDFDRLYDRKLYQTGKKIKGIRWKWWKPEYWLVKMQQS